MFELTRRRKIATLILVDSILLVFANIASYYFMKPFVMIPMDFMQISIVLSIVFYWFFGWIFRVFSRINRYTNLREMIAIFFALSLSSLSTIILLFFIKENYSMRLVVSTYFLSMFFIIASRLVWRLYIEKKNSRCIPSEEVKNTLILGAGEGGRILYNSLLGSKTAGDINVVGFIDDDPNKRHTYLSGKKVLGSIKDLPELVEKYEIAMITIA